MLALRWALETSQPTGASWATSGGDGWDEVDPDASVAAYRAALKERLMQAFPAATIEIIDVPRERSHAFRGEQDAGLASDSPRWYEVCRQIDEQLFAEPDAWVICVARRRER